MDSFAFEYLQNEEMSKEPKSPKGEKASEKYFERAFYNTGTGKFLGNSKELYDKLVSLEAKIETLKEVLFSWPQGSMPTSAEWILEDYQSEYDQLIKEHNL